ncbi:hypothetical protein BCR33DRAFT_680193 [Rhizoclosmatium globosum]|uniref:VWFA domain-containing protein n=1 Tax=Rhizoclosmatium globosum TaxID=329046 RepID=A0A1Y2C8S2_9FUNG|nr:hypothetical protein BCR33DRAFT_680193 [Rhizoclosmatium globosum]|eukprot:ORY42725.1 hypothetical protein BCR33DRAFT_680193 [Rhizoclosmatium globosum]
MDTFLCELNISNQYNFLRQRRINAIDPNAKTSTVSGAVVNDPTPHKTLELEVGESTARTTPTVPPGKGEILNDELARLRAELAQAAVEVSNWKASLAAADTEFKMNKAQKMLDNVTAEKDKLFMAVSALVGKISDRGHSETQAVVTGSVTQSQGPSSNLPAKPSNLDLEIASGDILNQLLNDEAAAWLGQSGLAEFNTLTEISSSVFNNTATDSNLMAPVITALEWHDAHSDLLFSEEQPPLSNSKVVSATKLHKKVVFGPVTPSSAEMYCLLLLTREQASNGSVAKIVICQADIERLSNDLVPGSYTSLSKIDFKVLNNISLALVGVYGNKAMIAKYLKAKGLVSESVYETMISGKTKGIVGRNAAESCLESGLYLLWNKAAKATDGVVVYWPEDSTWSDDNQASVARNRSTFMRYLSKVTVQQICLFGMADGEMIALNETPTNVDNFDEDNFDQERGWLEIEETSLQEEGAFAGVGFKSVYSRLLMSPNTPTVVTGSSTPGVVVQKPVGRSVERNLLQGDFIDFARLICQGRLPFSFACDLPEWFIRYLVEHGFQLRAPEATAAWKASMQHIQGEKDQKRAAIANLAQDQLEVRSYISNKFISHLNTLVRYKEGHTTITYSQAFEKAVDERVLAIVNVLPTNMENELRTHLKQIDGSDFGPLLSEIKKSRPLYDRYSYRNHCGYLNAVLESTDPTNPFRSSVMDAFADWADRKERQIADYFVNAYNKAMRQQYESELTEAARIQSNEANCSFRESCNSLFEGDIDSKWELLSIRELNNTRRTVSWNEIRVIPPSKACELYQFRLTQEDMFALGDNSVSLSPYLSQSPTATFSMGEKQVLRLCHVTEKHLILVIDDTEAGKCFIYARDHNKFDYCSPIKELHLSRLPDYNLAIYEKMGKLAFVSASLQLTIIEFRDEFKRADATQISLKDFYPENADFKESRVCWVNDREICIIESTGRSRIFMVASRQFRPAMLKLPATATNHKSSPDNSCLMYLNDRKLNFVFWNSFGSDNCRPHEIEFFDEVPFALVGFGDGKAPITRMYLLSIESSPDIGFIRSISLKITTKQSNLVIRSRAPNARNTHHNAEQNGSYPTCNCYIDVWYDIWREFPLAAPLKRKAITVSNLPPSILFVADGFIDDNNLRLYWINKIKKFNEKVKKPTIVMIGGQRVDILASIAISTKRFHSVIDEDIPLSKFKMGEWLIGLVCLIPIQLAVARNNQFLPMIDGISSLSNDRAMMGKNTSEIANLLTIGWLESIFHYYSDLPVKVISSLGEQSVGKSYTLNHLADTSFAGSAMRTTEGVWMAVSPTENYLTVCMDFEGLNSVERSLQEDNLLVLFNTAISNYILFRNNIAMSRAVQEMFKSFQASSSILEPEKNRPHLFNSVLVVVIKDIEDHQKTDIETEFRNKIEKIVASEQANNFITRLHNKRVKIVPWPFFQTPDFYRQFNLEGNFIDKRLDTRQQYPGGLKFLNAVKTLMAKLKISDWSSMDSSLIKTRVTWLIETLPNALSEGCVEKTPVKEPLRDLNTGVLIENTDDSEFSLPLRSIDTAAIKNVVIQYENICSRDGADEECKEGEVFETKWKLGLAAHCSKLLAVRFATVDLWIQSNVKGFPSANNDVVQLLRILEKQKQDVTESFNFCAQACSADTKCLLTCIQVTHDGVHDCGTDHICHRNCDFCQKLCGLGAGHHGDHFCSVSEHCCGLPCDLNQTQGCSHACVKQARHPATEGHLCASKSHKCMELCALRDIPTKNGEKFTCLNMCDALHDVEHDRHACKDTQLCPILCKLCQRPCSSQDHFHALNPDAIHLCGLDHPCPELCADDGICEVPVVPTEESAVYQGTLETFTFIRYVQMAKRLQCSQRIPAGKITHDGSHSHILKLSQEEEAVLSEKYEETFNSLVAQFGKDSEQVKTHIQSHKPKKIVHFCAKQCSDCNYYCKLEHNHAEDSHDTSHGNMINTTWTLEDDTGFVEVLGRKYASGDGGAAVYCNLVCGGLGRHVHVANCQYQSDESGGRCSGGTHHEHVNNRMAPHPDIPKDFISHEEKWKRSGFKDPYTNEMQAEFKLCDAFCPDPVHETKQYCTCSLFHAPVAFIEPGKAGTISSNGHLFPCTHLTSSAHHIIFVLDRSGSMSSSSAKPLEGTPVTASLMRTHPNCLGAAYSACFSFWTTREAVYSTKNIPRQDAYSVVLFDTGCVVPVENDFNSSPTELLSVLQNYFDCGGTDFARAMREVQNLIDRHWSDDCTPMVIFLSDGGDSYPQREMRVFTDSLLAKQTPVQFHTVGFGNYSFETLSQMVNECNAKNRSAGNDYNCGAYTAIGEIKLTETFMGIADSLTKRAALASS